MSARTTRLAPPARPAPLVAGLVAGLAALAAPLAPAALHAQGSGVYGQGIRLNLDSAGRKYVRFIVWNQTWARHEQFNPNTLVNGERAASNFDIGVRRSRLLMYGQLSPSNLILFHLGINNQTFNSGGAPGEATGPGKKPQVFIHDLWYEQRIVPTKLSLGFGLSYWNGISRQTSASTLNFLGVDAPIFNWPNIDATDQFARMPAVYAKGKLARLDYRVALSQPFTPGAAISTLPTTAGGAPIPHQAAYSNTTRTKATQGYLMWQFLDQEPNTLPFTVGSYLGTRRVFNLGAGWFSQPKAMRAFEADGSIRHHTQTLIGADVFADLPFGPASDRTAFTVYGVYYDYDFGPNFVRNVGIMNEGAPGPTPTGQNGVFNGGGNTFPQIGTGSIAHVEAGYLLPRAASAGIGRLQPYVQLTRSDFDRLDDAFTVPEIGLNWHLEGHHAKYTLHYRSRPIFRTLGDVRPDGLRRVTFDGERKGELILQAMMYF